MRLKLKTKLIALFAFMSAFLIGCSDHKEPIDGYISQERVDELILGFDSTVSYTKYSYEGNLNYFEYDEELVPRTITKRNLDFSDSKDKYSDKSASYYLRLPLHITKENWVSEEINMQGLSLSTKYQLESKLYRPAGYDSIYYYEKEDGGFILRTFAVNKALMIKNPSGITCRAKWNIEAEYDKNGYLIREQFSTVNYPDAKNSECCYGQATYKYS